MVRTRGKVCGVVVAIAATGLLAACGNNDSTASSTPTLAPTSAAPQSPLAPDAGLPTGGYETPPPVPESATPTPELERPAPAEPSPSDTSNLPDKDKQFLDQLSQKGITPGTPDIALSIGQYVCQAAASGASDQDLSTYVSAMAGSDPTFDPAKMPVEQAGQIYIETAKQSYCQ
ncbi:DUF732 domain-containing protein [Nocardia callitridis]|uniref:DUF732 domain-containing protein n=1 Tax=Nocardia callitridis TaxID=648753 RepID=A0ABP9K119_9NOCA